MTDERLIEEAARALYMSQWHDGDYDRTSEFNKDAWRMHARAALAVFEKAHTPTDDEREAEYLCDTCGEYMPCSCASDREVGGEREAIWDAFDDMHRITEGGCDTRGKDVADMVLGLGFRRSEPEPSAEVTHRGTFGHVWPCPLFYVGNWKRGDEEYYPAAECSNAAVCKRSEPQGEPSDADYRDHGRHWWACAVNAPRPEWRGPCDCDLSRDPSLTGHPATLRAAAEVGGEGR